MVVSLRIRSSEKVHFSKSTYSTLTYSHLLIKYSMSLMSVSTIIIEETLTVPLNAADVDLP